MRIDEVATDVRLAFRSFRKAPGFTLASVLVLGLGLGAVTLMFSTLDSVALRPLPFDDPEELVWVWATSDQASRNSISHDNYADYRAQVDAFDDLAAFLVFRPAAVLTQNGDPERVVSNYVTPNLFPMLGVEPVAGRGFVDADGLPGADPVVVLSHGLWLRRFGASTSAVGTALTLDGTPVEVVGVMPQGFDYPGGVDLWLPSREHEGYAQGRGNNNFFAVGRLRDGVDLRQAQAQANVVARQLQEAYPESNEGWGVTLVPLHERYFAGARQALAMLLGIVTVVLLIACANVASLAMARSTTRRGEIAVRLSLGASRTRVVRQLLTEHMVVALSGGALGLGIAAAGVRALKAFGPATLPRLDTVAFDGRALAFALVAAALTGLVFGTVPALRGTALTLADCLKAGGRSPGLGRTGGRATLVVAQVALSLMLMMASGLFLRSFIRLQAVDMGFDVERLLLAEIQIPATNSSTGEEVQHEWDEIQASLAALPGVRAVGAIDQLPLRSGGTWSGVYAQGREPERTSDYLSAQRRFVSEGYVEALGLPLVGGRTFETTDDRGSSMVTVVSQSLVEELWPGEDAVGRFLILPSDPDIPLEIVGIVGDLSDQGPGVGVRPTFYLAMRQGLGNLGTLRVVMRTASDPMTTAASLRDAIWTVDSDIPVSGVETMEDRVADRVSQPRFRASLVALFALTALILAVLGLYAVLAFYVRQRTHEIAVRVAVGAGRFSVMGLVLRKGLSLVGLGVAVGLAGSLAAGELLRGFLFGVAPRDPVTLSVVTATMLLVALPASLIPALKAVRVAPVEALNTE
jgi:putative ABC transport system permease protein